MADYGPAFGVLMEHEGGFVNHPSDPGGATNYGISLRWLRRIGDADGDGWLDGDLDKDGDVDIEDIKRLTIPDVFDLCKSQFWDRYRYDAIKSQKIANKVLSLSFHAGPGRCHRVLQQAIRYHAPIVVDGIIGPMTRASTNSTPEARLLTEFRHEQAAFYRSLVQQNDKMNAFIKGWLNRAYS